MNTINVATPTRTNMDTAMANIGFTVDIIDENTSDYTWDDQGGYAKLRYAYDPNLSNSSYMYYQHWFTGSATNIRYIYANLGSLPIKICYELLLNGGIAIGFTQTANTPIQVAFIAPKTSADSWVVTDYWLATCDYSRLKFIGYGSNASPYNNANGGLSPYSNDVQIIKAYNNQRFMDNLYLTLLAPNIDVDENVRATVGNKEYLIIGNGYPVKAAVELPS